MLSLPFAEVGWGEVMLALVPTINIVVIAFIYKVTGKARNELEGTVLNSKQAIQHDLKNGITDRLDTINKRIDDKKIRLIRVEKKVDELAGKIE